MISEIPFSSYFLPLIFNAVCRFRFSVKKTMTKISMLYQVASRCVMSPVAAGFTVPAPGRAGNLSYREWCGWGKGDGALPSSRSGALGPFKYRKNRWGGPPCPPEHRAARDGYPTGMRPRKNFSNQKTANPVKGPGYEKISEPGQGVPGAGRGETSALQDRP
jgi:hypothetical protein